MISKFKKLLQSAVKAVQPEQKKVDELEAPAGSVGPSHFSHGISPYGKIPEKNIYRTVPAPVVQKEDPWFSTPTRTEKQIDYMEKEMEVKQQEEQRRIEQGGEPEDIHERIYQIATRSWNTVKESQGGSENFQEGGWNSGNGMGQFR